MRRLTLATLTTVLLLAGCTSGSDSDGPDETDASSSSDSPAATDSTAKTPDSPGEAEPDCDTVWKAGHILPGGYTSCLDDGESVKPDVTACKDGSSLIVHLDSFYAVTGKKIVEPDVAPLQDTDEFGSVYESCTGE